MASPPGWKWAADRKRLKTTALQYWCTHRTCTKPTRSWDFTLCHDYGYFIVNWFICWGKLFECFSSDCSWRAERLLGGNLVSSESLERYLICAVLMWQAERLFGQELRPPGGNSTSGSAFCEFSLFSLPKYFVNNQSWFSSVFVVLHLILCELPFSNAVLELRGSNGVQFDITFIVYRCRLLVGFHNVFIEKFIWLRWFLNLLNKSFYLHKRIAVLWVSLASSCIILWQIQPSSVEYCVATKWPLNGHWRLYYWWHCNGIDIIVTFVICDDAARW